MLVLRSLLAFGGRNIQVVINIIASYNISDALLEAGCMLSSCFAPVET